MKIWISGLAGFVGSHIAEECIKRGDTVAGNDSLICGDRMNVPVGAKFRQFRCQERARFLDELREFKPEVIVHCAATAHEGLSTFSPHFITENIFEASLATFSAAIACGSVTRIVNMSSMSRYGDQEVPFTEDMEPKPLDPYAVGKVAAENALKILAETHGIKWTTLVPHSIIGTRQRYCDPYRNVAAIMANRCLRGDPPIIYGDGKQVRCFSPIADCLPSILKAIDGGCDYEIVNIGPDTGELTIGEMANKIIRLTGFAGKPRHMPDRPNEAKIAYCSSDKARTLLGYQEQQSLDSCLAEMVEYIKRKGPKPFEHSFPLEIVSDKMPVTWRERLM